MPSLSRSLPQEGCWLYCNNNSTRYLLQSITQPLYMVQEEAQRNRYPSIKLPLSAALSKSV